MATKKIRKPQQQWKVTSAQDAQLAIGALNNFYLAGRVDETEYARVYAGIAKAWKKFGLKGRPPSAIDENPISAAERRSMPVEEFAWPERRKYPVHDAAHAKNALVRLNQAYDAGRVNAQVYRKVYKRIMKAYKQFGITTGTAPRVPILEVLPGGRKAAVSERRKAAAANPPGKRRLPVLQPYDKAWLKDRQQRVASPNPTGVGRNDPVHMRSIAMRALAKPNPAHIGGNEDLAVRLNIPDIALEADAAGTNLSSLGPEDYYDLLEQQGVSGDKALAHLEEIASWGVTDEVQ